MGILKRKKSQEQDEVRQSVPAIERTFGHSAAIAFSQAIIDKRWSDAEQLFGANALVDQGHMVSVASNIGGGPASLDPWVSEGHQTGVAELVRGALGIVDAWDTRSGAAAAALESSVIDTFHETLGQAETDLGNAADKMPASSLPWQHLLTSGRGLHVNRMEMDDRYVRHIERGELLAAHMSFQQLVSKKWAGSHEEMWEHAEWILHTARAGSPNHVLVAIALIEHHIKADVRYESIRELPGLIGKSEALARAAHRSYADPNFDASTPEGAMALSAWFTLHYLLGNWELASDLVPMIGDRFAQFPMAYFQETSWAELQTFLNKRMLTAVS